MFEDIISGTIRVVQVICPNCRYIILEEEVDIGAEEHYMEWGYSCIKCNNVLDRVNVKTFYK